MDPVAIARWQFGITTVYHFLFVPITIAMSMLVAVLQTIWVRTGAEQYLRLTKFFGKLFLINFALGVVTGIVQEFQLGMNWSEYSRFVGDGQRLTGPPQQHHHLLLQLAPGHHDGILRGSGQAPGEVSRRRAHQFPTTNSSGLLVDMLKF